MLPEASNVIERPKAAAVPTWLEWKGSGCVLVIDDDEAVRLVLLRTLTKIGFSVTLAADGTEAVAHMEADPTRYNLALLDYKLPGMDSGTVFCQIRSKRPDIPVILMSGYSREDAADRSSGMDFADFLHKPFTVDVLATKVRTALGA
ncbi:MAG TPA: response regulator [Opitutaceae bacterium]|jgi:DNA-binding NtrC family response regulator|nr:response regulator [Opitutaceae bacterium]